MFSVSTVASDGKHQRVPRKLITEAEELAKVKYHFTNLVFTTFAKVHIYHYFAHITICLNHLITSLVFA